MRSWRRELGPTGRFGEDVESKGQVVVSTSSNSSSRSIH